MPAFLSILPGRFSESPIDSQGWARALGLSPLSGAEELEGNFRNVSLEYGSRNAESALRAWVTHANLREVLGIIAPTREQVEECLLLPAPADDVRAPYEWLCQRSIVDALDRWSTEALHLEYNWQNGDAVELFSSAALAGLRPDRGLLNAEIAARAVNPPPVEGEITESLFWQLQDAAVDFLRKGRYTEAAALFEFHRRDNPHDVRSINNLGFCKLPVDPAGALHLLRQAESSGYAPIAMNIYNQCCCLKALNREGEALDKAEWYWQRQREEPDWGGYLWVKNEDSWVLKAGQSPFQAIIALAIELARSLGLEDRAERWAERQIGH